MSDRWGYSVDCSLCGQPQSQIYMRHCYSCERDMCKECLDDHKCVPIMEAARRAVRTGNHKDLHEYLKLRREQR